MQISNQERDLPNLDLLRSLAVGLVFIGHLMGTMKVRLFGDLGRLGVLLFFVHTSFVLMLSMERMELSGLALFSNFLIRRVFRIYPLSILAVALAVTVHIPPVSWDGSYIWPGWSDVLSNVFLSQDFTRSGSVLCVLWSLPFEVQMYAILPALFLLLRRHTSIWAVAVIWLAGIAIAVLEYIARNGKGDLDFLIARYFPCFLAGIAAWRLSRTFLSKISGTAWAFYLVFLALAYRFVDILRVYGTHSWSALHGTLRVDHRIWWPSFVDLPRDWAFCALTALAIPLFTQVEQRQVNGFTKWIATYSYGIYICHIPILWLCFVRFHLWSASVGAVLSTLLTAFTASLLYHLVENPGIRAGKRLASRMSSRLSLATEPNHDVQGVPTVSGN